MTGDLFGYEPPPVPYHKQPDGIKRGRERTPKPKGYARRPGSGPEGERCNTCAHYWVSGNGRFRKCELLRHCWTNSYGTDIRAKSPACELWEKPREETYEDAKN